MPTIGKIKAELWGDTRQFDRAMRRSGRQVDSLQTKFRSFRGAIAPLIGAAGFSSLIRSTVTEAERMDQLSTRLGITTDQFSRLARVLARSGIGMEQTATMLQRLQRRAVEARDGSKGLAKAFSQVGIDVHSLLLMDPVDAFLRFGEALTKMQLPAERIHAAFKILDTEGVQVLQADLGNLGKQMADTSALSTDQAVTIRRLAEAWAVLGEKMRAVTAVAIEKLKLPEALSSASRLIDTISNQGVVASSVGPIMKGNISTFMMIARALGLAPNAAAAGGGAGIARPQLTSRGGVISNIPPSTSQTGRIQGTGIFTGGDLGPSNEIIAELRGIRRNTEHVGAVLE